MRHNYGGRATAQAGPDSWQKQRQIRPALGCNRAIGLLWLTVAQATQLAMPLPIQARLPVEQPTGQPAGQLAQASTQTEQVTGTVTYRTRIALPPNATVNVKLQEVSRLDAPAVTLAEQTIPTNGQQVPFAFALSYDPSQIDPRYTYVVQARILVDGQLRWISTTAYQVITRGNPSQVDVVVEPVSSPAATAPERPAQPSPSPSPSPSQSTARYTCTARRGFPTAEAIGLEEAQRLRLQRDGDRFVYQCESVPEPEIRYDCRSQNPAYPSRTVGLAEAERLLQQTSNQTFVYGCSPVEGGT